MKILFEENRFPYFYHSFFEIILGMKKKQFWKSAQMKCTRFKDLHNIQYSITWKIFFKTSSIDNNFRWTIVQNPFIAILKNSFMLYIHPFSSLLMSKFYNTESISRWVDRDKNRLLQLFFKMAMKGFWTIVHLLTIKCYP
jgi:hypothetical protein